MKKCLATDLDGTLFEPKSHDAFVCPENLKTLELFDDTIIVTGRPPAFVRRMCKETGIKETFVACNGSVIYYDGNLVFIDYLDSQLINEIIDYVAKKYSTYRILLLSNDEDFYCLSSDLNKTQKDEEEEHNKYLKTRGFSNKDKTKIKEMLNKEKAIIKVNVYLDKEDKDSLYDYLLEKGYDSLLNLIKCQKSIEINGLGLNKGNSLLKLVELMGYSPDEVYVAGDDTNDLPMLTGFKHAFMIKNESNKDIRHLVKYNLDKFTDIASYVKE